METTKYINGFHSPRGIDPAIYTTTAKGIEYRGHKIYHRICSTTAHGNCWDVVKDGVCIGQYAGLSGAQRLVDMIHGEGDPEVAPFWRQRAAETLARALSA